METKENEYVNKNDKRMLAGAKGFDDKEQRKAFKKMVRTCQVLNSFLIDYFDIESDKKYKIIDDPIGEYKVDLGI